MKKKILMIGLIVGLFMVVSSGVAVAAPIEFNDGTPDTIGDQVTFQGSIPDFL